MSKWKMARAALSVFAERRRQRVFEEEAQHLPRGVRSPGIGVGAFRAASRPGVSGAMDVPVFQDCAPVGIAMDGAGIGVASLDPGAMHLLLRARGSPGLFDDVIAVAGMHGDIPIAMKN